MKLTSAEIEKHYRIALDEVGDITPVFDEETSAWVFQHPAYDLEAHGNTPAECVDTYKKWLKEFITFRLQGRLADNVEVATSGRGGYRPNSGRPRKSPTSQIRVPTDIANWLKADESHIEQVRKLMQG